MGARTSPGQVRKGPFDLGGHQLGRVHLGRERGLGQLQPLHQARDDNLELVQAELVVVDGRLRKAAAAGGLPRGLRRSAGGPFASVALLFHRDLQRAQSGRSGVTRRSATLARSAVDSAAGCGGLARLLALDLGRHGGGERGRVHRVDPKVLCSDIALAMCTTRKKYPRVLILTSCRALLAIVNEWYFYQLILLGSGIQGLGVLG